MAKTVYDGSRFQRWIANLIVKYSPSYKGLKSNLAYIQNELDSSNQRRARLDAELKSLTSQTSQEKQDLLKKLMDSKLELSDAKTQLGTIDAKYLKLNDQYRTLQETEAGLEARTRQMAGELEVSKVRLVSLEKEREMYHSDLEKKDGLIGHLQYQQRLDRRRLRETINAYPRAVLLLDSLGKVYAQNIKSREILNSQKNQDFVGRLDLKNSKKQQVQIGDYTYSCKIYSLSAEEGYRVEVKPHFFKRKTKPKIETKSERSETISTDEEIKRKIAEINRGLQDFSKQRGLTEDGSADSPVSNS
jgi:septal ring factor EnvC (AmiA/AmiB activator)